MALFDPPTGGWGGPHPQGTFPQRLARAPCVSLAESKMPLTAFLERTMVQAILEEVRAGRGGAKTPSAMVSRCPSEGTWDPSGS